MIDLHFATLLEMASGKLTSRTGTVLEAAAASRSDVPVLCLQLLVELSQRHAAMAKIFDGNVYLLRYLGVAPQSGEEADEDAQLPSLEEHDVQAEIAAGAGSATAAVG